MEHPILNQLHQRPLLCDGAMGSLLYARGVTYEQCFDALNLSQPELITNIHSEYINAGAEVIETNSFGANRAKLEAYNLGDRVREINFRAVRLARDAREISGQPIYVAGAVGPTGRPLQAPDEHRLVEVRAIFQEQIEALQEGGADLLILETFSSLAELRQAILAAKEVGGLPIIAQMSFYEDGHTLSGQSAARIAAVLDDMGVDVMGANCSVGPAATLDVLEEMVAEVQRNHDGTQSRTHLFSAQPNAGLPTRIGNRFFYVATPDYFADYALRFAKAGVQFIGGCCGTTPHHIAAATPRAPAVFSAATGAARTPPRRGLCRHCCRAPTRTDTGAPRCATDRLVTRVRGGPRLRAGARRRRNREAGVRTAASIQRWRFHPPSDGPPARDRVRRPGTSTAAHGRGRRGRRTRTHRTPDRREKTGPLRQSTIHR